MNKAKPTPGDFSLMQFSLGLGADGRPIQHVTACGSFASIELVFASARRLADREVERLLATGSAGTEARQVELIDTEWGYDIRRGWLTVTRFWVHDAAATQPLLAGKPS
jgi:hypothetical protein